jgi:phosphatidylglycerophosphate synthase
VLLLASFVTDCVDGQLARYTGTFSRLGGWLDAMFDRAKEYLAFAGLAIGAGDVWLLACAAITLQTVRHAADFSFAAVQQDAVRPPPIEEPLDGAARPARILAAWRGFDTWAPLRWGKRMIAFPIGERFAVIALTAALFTPRVTFVALLAWGGVALAYSQAGRVLRSLR